MQIINLTPHEVVCNGRAFPSKGAARVVTKDEEIAEIDGIPIVKIIYDSVKGLPSPSPDKLYIVSYMVLQALPDRIDLVCPARLQRDTKGTIIGCAAFETYINANRFRENTDGKNTH
jgi:hypothetical protein